MKNILLIFSLLAFIACDNKHKKNKANPPLNKVGETRISNSETLKVTTPVQKKQFYFVYENDTLLQKLVIKSLNTKLLEFSLTSTNKSKNKTFNIEGVAKAKNTSDLEIDEDEDGNAYPAQVYIFEKDCWLSFRIDMESKDKIRIVEADCDKFHNESCLFGSIGVLRLLK